LFFHDIRSNVGAASPGVFFDIKGQEDADEIENDIDVVGPEEETDDKC
jgi:hypothetical protein